jgi:hypothetical protein
VRWFFGKIHPIVKIERIFKKFVLLLSEIYILFMSLGVVREYADRLYAQMAK